MGMSELSAEAFGSPTGSAADARIAAVVASLADAGYAVVRDFIDAKVVADLRDHASALAEAGAFVPAAVDRGARRVERADIRGDRIAWLGEDTGIACERALLDAIESLRLAINRSLYLGLFDFEGHYALYLPGARYARHRDGFAVDSPVVGRRVVSCVLYLNASWQREHGGALRLHLDPLPSREVLPVAGTLVAFLSDRFEHEVLPATRERLAVTGWLRRRGT